VKSYTKDYLTFIYTHMQHSTCISVISQQKNSQSCSAPEYVQPSRSIFTRTKEVQNKKSQVNGCEIEKSTEQAGTTAQDKARSYCTKEVIIDCVWTKAVGVTIVNIPYTTPVLAMVCQYCLQRFAQKINLP
jgi:hypothetical protein